jgi:CarD family transcriptional regulator
VDFKIGERVVYPNHGVGIVNNIEEKKIDGKTSNFYSLKILSNDTTVFVPADNMYNVGIRKVINKKEVKDLFVMLEQGQVRTFANWKNRFKENSEKMRTGCIFEVADVLKSLFHLSHNKSLSYREKRMFDKAKQLIVSEITEVSKSNPKRIETLVDKALSISMNSRMNH